MMASIGDYLESMGFAMDFAADGAIALNLLEENPYDVIISRLDAAEDRWHQGLRALARAGRRHAHSDADGP